MEDDEGSDDAPKGGSNKEKPGVEEGWRKIKLRGRLGLHFEGPNCFTDEIKGSNDDQTLGDQGDIG